MSRMSANSIPGLRARASSPFRSLLSMQMKLAYGPKGLAEKLGLGKKARNAYLYVGLLALAFLPLMSMLYTTARLIAVQSIALGQPGLPVVMAVTAGQFLVFFMGISSVMSVLYYSNDIETLLGLPLTARQIMLAKLLVVYAAEAVISIVATGPFLLALGNLMGTAEYWFSAVLVEALIPAIPMALSLLATVLIMRLTKGSRKRDQFRVVLGLLFFVLILGVQYLNTSMATQGPEETMRMLFERNGLIQAAAGYYPPLKWAAWALTGDSPAARFGGLALFCGVSFGILAVVTSVAQGWFLGGLSTDVTTSRKAAPVEGTASDRRTAKKTASTGRMVFRSRSPALAVALRDHRVLMRTPNFLLVTLTNLTVFPLILVFSSLGSQGNIPYLTGGAPESLLDTIALILVGIHGFIVAGNQVSSTAITREGSAFWASKMIPVPPREQVRGKIMYGLMVAGIQLAVMLATAGLVMKIDGGHLAVVAVLGAFISLPITAICIMNDLRAPKLTWEDPHQAMKGNFGTLVAMLFSLLYVGGVAFIVRMLMSAGVAIAYVYGIAAAILAVTGVMLKRAAEAMAETRYREIEV